MWRFNEAKEIICIPKEKICAINEGKFELKKSPRQTSKRHISKALAIKVQILRHIKNTEASSSNEEMIKLCTFEDQIIQARDT